MKFFVRVSLCLASFSCFAPHLSVPCHAADPFTRINTGPVVTNVNCTGPAWGDFNNDGYIDLFLSPFGRASLLFSNNGDGTFSRVLAGNVTSDSGNTFGSCWGDYDNDGLLDLFVSVNNQGNDWLYRNMGGGAFAKVLAGPIVGSGGNANNCSWGDYDNDGFIDLFVANSDQNDFLFHNNGDGSFSRVTGNPIALKPGNSQGGGWADYDNDGRVDLFVSRVNEPNLLYHNDGGGVFTAVTNDPIVSDRVAAQGTSWGDYDNDGNLDMFVAQAGGTRNLLYRNNGDGTFTKVLTGPVATDVIASSSGSWGDYDNDGLLDLFVANRSGNNFLYRNQGGGTFERVTGSVIGTDAPSSFSAAWGDYDNDGFLDLVVTCAPNAISRLYHNNANTNSWLTVRCEGRFSNRAAIGAKVRVLATIGGRSVWQFREISGGQNLGSQDDMRPHFGLGDATNVSALRMEWPSGVVQQIVNVPVRQVLSVTEPAAFVAPPVLEALPGSAVTFTIENAPAMACQWTHDGAPIPGQTNRTLTIAAAGPNDGGSYAAILTDPVDGSFISVRAAKLSGPVVIARHPQSRNVTAGSAAIFAVSAEGQGPLRYQWQRDGISLDGATNSTLTITNVQVATEGSYRVIISNSFGVVFSQVALLQALIRPVIVVQPLSQSVVAGGSVTLAVAATGNPLPLTFRWRQGTTFFTNVSVYASNCFIEVRNVQPATNASDLRYSVVVTNLAGVVLSSPADLLVLPDRDGDGLPDDWETTHGLNAEVADSIWADEDSDGASNRDEYRAGTDPADGGSMLKLAITKDASGAVLDFIAVSNRTYSILMAQGLTAEWTRARDILPASSNRVVRVTEEIPGTVRLYRVVTPRKE